MEYDESRKYQLVNETRNVVCFVVVVHFARDNLCVIVPGCPLIMDPTVICQLLAIPRFGPYHGLIRGVPMSQGIKTLIGLTTKTIKIKLCNQLSR